VVDSRVDEDTATAKNSPAAILLQQQENGSPSTVPIASSTGTTQSGNDGSPIDEDGLPKIKERLIGHHLYRQNKPVLINLDIKTGGKSCGIVQLSAKIIQSELEREEGKVAKDQLYDPVFH
jgi:hypothetical protein